MAIGLITSSAPLFQHENNDVEGTPTPTPTPTPTSTATSTPSTSPFLSVSPDPIFFNVDNVNSGESVSQMFSISNTGDGTLIWSISDDQPWITVYPSSGTNSGTVAVNINTAGLSFGIHKGTITITSNGGNKNVAVSLYLHLLAGAPPASTPTPTSPALTPTPTPTPIPPPTSTQIDISKIVEDELKKLAAGRILFNPPKEMTVGEPEKVEVRLTKTSLENLSNKSLIEGTRGLGEPQIESVGKVGTFMKVSLTGKNFDIKLLNGDEEKIVSERFTQWEYDVTPLESGAQKLRIDVFVRIKIPNDGEEKQDYGVYEKQINVKVNPVYSIITFMENNWQWTLTTITGLSGAMIGWTMKKKKKSGEKKYLQKKLRLMYDSK